MSLQELYPSGLNRRQRRQIFHEGRKPSGEELGSDWQKCSLGQKSWAWRKAAHSRTLEQAYQLVVAISWPAGAAGVGVALANWYCAKGSIECWRRAVQAFADAASRPWNSVCRARAARKMNACWRICLQTWGKNFDDDGLLESSPSGLEARICHLSFRKWPARIAPAKNAWHTTPGTRQLRPAHSELMPCAGFGWRKTNLKPVGEQCGESSPPAGTCTEYAA